MRRLTDTDGLTGVQREILRTVREFVDAEVLPIADAARRIAPAIAQRASPRLVGRPDWVSRAGKGQ